MKCPVCAETDLLMAERQGVEIDYCPKCRGIWLDRGELDKIIERSTLEYATPSGGERGGRDEHRDRDETRSPSDRDRHDDRDRSERDKHDRDRHDDRGYEKKRRGSFLGDILGGLGE
jgi:Zn-finger nucleic acid-binding protein